MTDRTPLDAPDAHGRSRAPLAVRPEPTDADIAAEGAAAAHALINIAEDLARYLRLVTGGALTLTVAQNRAISPGARDKAGVLDTTDAHEFTDRVVGPSNLRAVLEAQISILRGDGAIGEHLARNIDKVAPR